LAQQVEEILAITGSQKVNLIGHSHGGPTSRYVAGIMPTQVASVTAVGSPQKGSPVANVILSIEGTPLQGPLVSVVNLFSKAIVWAQACGEGAYQEKGIQFYSFTGNTAVTNLLDLDSALLGTSLLINAGRDNDGLVSRCSAKFGKTIRDDYRWNHLDEVNQILGLRAIFSPDPVQVYREHTNRLKLQGL
jgi:triacylglycerol lipase